ncbi:MAG: SusC/RagA family TonB-linked outer membrane protein, partial [Bacteroidales bacterium]|nr:SusC/RagA family TonB-linked outer membrane protein [Bacteroidales bacterium]
MEKKILFLIFFTTLNLSIFAQGITVSGTIVSGDDNFSIPSASVLIKGTTKGTVSDLEGNYKISGLTEEDILVFSFMGYHTQEITVGSKRVINIILQPDAQNLEEFVVTALGIKRQERELGYATENFTGKEIALSNTPNVLNAIGGKSAGVQISTGDGVEGGTTRITIRGNNNLYGDNQPLIVVDGIPIDNPPGLTNIGRGTDWGSAINNINSADIESVDILKGGPASALYGSRGANGVVLITTKRGTKQKGIGIDYNFTYKTVSPYRYRKVQNVYGGGAPLSLSPPTFPIDDSTGLPMYPSQQYTDNLIIDTSGTVSSTEKEFGYYGSAVSWGPKMDGQMIEWWDKKMRPWSPQPDNLKMFYHNGNTQTHNIAVSGGSEKGTVRVSLTKTDNNPIISNSSFNQTTINLGANLKASEKVNIDVTASYVDYNRLNSPILGESHESFNKGILYCWPRSYKGIDMNDYELPNGSRNDWGGNYPFVYINKNLWWNYNKNNSRIYRNNFLGAIRLTYDITPWLSFQGRVGRNFTFNKFEKKYTPFDVLGLKGYYSSTTNRIQSDNYDCLLSYHKENIMNSNISIDFSVGGSKLKDDRYGIGGRSGTLESLDEAEESGSWYYPNFYTFFNYTQTVYEIDENGRLVVKEQGDDSEVIVPSETIYKRETNSVYSFLNLKYKDFLFLELTGRNDWSSTLPVENNSYFYPSLSFSFILTEAFDFRLEWLNFLKIRGGAAQTATDTDPYQTEFYYNVGFYGGKQTASYPNIIPPFALKPQRVNSYEFGTTISVLDNKIDIDFTYYSLYSFDQIITAPLPVSSGASNIMINNGSMSNKGIEIMINTVPIQTNEITVETGLNFSRNRNRIENLGDYADIFPLADIWGYNGPAMALKEGDDYGTIVGYDYVYHENGQPILNDAGTHYKITDTRVPIGNASPDFIAGWTTRVRYKGFVLSTLVDTKWGGDIYCGSYVTGLQTGQSPETLREREGGGLPYMDPEGNVSNIGVILNGVYE